MSRIPQPPESSAQRIGGWLPHDKSIIRDAVNHIVKHANANPSDLVPPMQALSDLIYNNQAVFMLFTEMLNEVPPIGQYIKDPSLQPEIRDVPTLLNVLNYQIQQPIKYNDSVQIGTPINAILDWPMGTKAGFAAFIRDDVNTCFEAILNYWGAFLQSKTSTSVATVSTGDGGWLSTTAQNDPNSPGLKDFLQTYKVPDPTDTVHYGFQSWDEFFTRQFKDIDTQRPTGDPGNTKAISSVAECTPFAFKTNVQLLDQFWAKDQNYSLQFMLGDASVAQKFVGGSVWQAFLSADSYHCWHAPVSGQFIADPVTIGGTYYSEPLLWGFDPDVTDKIIAFPDPAADARSQGYISCIAKRGVAYIQPDDASIGLVALVMIGMAEVSSVEFYVKGGQHFNKGDPIGCFHFGGSTHCVVFGPGVTVTLESDAVVQDSTHYNLGDNVVPVRSTFATVTPNGNN